MILLDDFSESIYMITKDGETVLFMSYDKMDKYRETSSRAAICAIRIMARIYGGLTIAELAETGRLSES